MDKRRLECFVALAEELHFHRAAARCHISQPGLSQQLRQLERQLQVQLLFRSKRQVSLTHAGAIFLSEARKLLQAMEQSVALTRQIDQGLLGSIHIGATPSALFVALPEIVARFRASLPKVHVQISQMTMAEQEDALKAGRIHAGLVHPPLADENLACASLGAIPFDLVLSTENPLAERTRLTMADLADETFILFPRALGPRLYDQIIALSQESGFSPRKIIEVSPAQSIVAMAACGLGIGFVASRVQHYQRAFAAYRRLEGAAPQLTLGIAHLADRPPPLVTQFLVLAQEAAIAFDEADGSEAT